jgi:hypothetical protein
LLPNWTKGGVDEEVKEEVMYLLDLLRFKGESEDVGGKVLKQGVE